MRVFIFNPIALRTAKTLWSFGCFECNRVKTLLFCIYLQVYAEATLILPLLVAETFARREKDFKSMLDNG